MNRLLLGIVLMISTSLSLFAQSSTRNLRGFDSIDLRMSADVILTQDARYSVRIDAPQRNLRQIQTTVRNQTLIIDARGNISTYNEPIRIYVSAPHFNNINLSSSGNIKLDALRENHLNLNLSGSGDIQLNQVQLRTAYLSISGSGNVDILGSASFFDISLSGSGNVEARDFRVDSGKIAIAGSGNVNIAAHRNLNVTIAGSGNVGYTGNPRIQQSIHGSGEVRRL